LAASERAAAGDDDLGAGELRPLAVRRFERNEAAGAFRSADVDLLDARAAALARGLVEGGGADGDHFLGVVRLDGRDGVSGVDRTGEGVRPLDRQDVA